MTKILVATDFSNAAKNASDYALQLAKYLHASIELIHTFDIPFTFADSGIQYIDIHELERNTNDALKDEVKRLELKETGVGIAFRCCVGRINDCLNEIVNKENPMMIVFGMSGESDSFLWGSTAVSALRSFDVPVLIVPKNAVWNGVKNICYAVNYKKQHTTTPYDLVVNWTQKFTDKLTIFNVHNVGENIEPSQKLKESLQSLNTNYVSFESDNFEIGIQDFLSENNVDWLIIIPQKHGFFDRIMSNSHSRQIAKVSSVPVLSFYEK